MASVLAFVVLPRIVAVLESGEMTPWLGGIVWGPACAVIKA